MTESQAALAPALLVLDMDWTLLDAEHIESERQRRLAREAGCPLAAVERADDAPRHVERVVAPRPGLAAFLRGVEPLFGGTVVFSSSVQDRVDALIDALRRHLRETDGYDWRPLAVLGGDPHVAHRSRPWGATGYSTWCGKPIDVAVAAANAARPPGTAAFDRRRTFHVDDDPGALERGLAMHKGAPDDTPYGILVPAYWPVPRHDWTRGHGGAGDTVLTRLLDWLATPGRLAGAADFAALDRSELRLLPERDWDTRVVEKPVLRDPRAAYYDED